MNRFFKCFYVFFIFLLLASNLYAAKISELPEDTDVSGLDWTVVVDPAYAQTSKITLENLLDGVQKSKGTYYTNGNIAAAVTAIGSTECDLIVDTSETLGASLNLSALKNIHLKFRKGAVITVPSGITFIGNGQEEIVPYQVFALTGTGVVTGLREVTPEMFGAKADGTTNDAAAINAASLSLATKGVLHLFPGRIYSTEAAILIPTSATFNMTGATIRSHYAGSAIQFGTSGTLIGNGATIYNDVDYAGGLLSTAVKNNEAEIKILGWPYIYNGATARYTGSIGIDGEVYYRSHIEAKLANFETGIKIGGGTETIYHNRIVEPDIANCVYPIKVLKSSLEYLTLDVAPGTDWTTGDTITGESGTTAKVYNKYGTSGLIWRIYDRSGDFTDGEIISNGFSPADQGTGYPTITAINANDLRITNPRINGSNYAKKAIWLDGVGSFSILGGYIEGMLQSDCRGLYFDDVNGGTVQGLTLDSTADSGQYAIEAIGSSTNVTFVGNRLGGSWAASTLYLNWAATGVYNWIGQAGGAGIYKLQANNFKVITVDASKSIEGDSSTSITLSIPIGAKLLGATLEVTSALATGELWNAAYSGGKTTAIASAQAVAKNTKVTTMFDPNAASPITSGALTHIAITRDGGGNFTAQGSIRAIVAYEYFTPIADLP